MHSLREQEYESVYETFYKTNVLLARPGPIFDSEHPFADLPNKIPRKNVNLGPGAVGDDPGFYLMGSLTGKILRIENPIVALNLTFAAVSVIPLFLLFFYLKRQRPELLRNNRIYFLVGLITLSRGLWSPIGTNMASSEGVLRVGAPYVFGSTFLFGYLICMLEIGSTHRVNHRRAIILAVLCGYCAFLCRVSTVIPILVGGITMSLMGLLLIGTGINIRKIVMSTALVFLAIIGLQRLTLESVDVVRDKNLSYAAPKDLNTYQFWGTIYVGLGWQGKDTGLKSSAVGVTWSDRIALQDALTFLKSSDTLDPRIESAYRRMYFELWQSKPLSVAKIYLDKIWVALQREALLMTLLFGITIAQIKYPRRPRIRKHLSIGVPILVGASLIEPVLSAPFVFYLGNFSTVVQALIIVLFINTDDSELQRMCRDKVRKLMSKFDSKIKNQLPITPTH
jgi:hypothetical protein